MQEAGGSGTPALVTLHVWGVPGRAIPAALARMALDRPHVRPFRHPAAPTRPDQPTPPHQPGRPTFAKLLGTGRGATFTPRDADPQHWALLATWDADADAAAFESSVTARGWDALACERLLVRLRPLSSRGSWAGRAPFGPSTAPTNTTQLHTARPGQAVASITRARLRWTRTRRFWAAVPDVARDLADADGLRLALGIGEAPVALMGTFSLWRDAEALGAFAHRGAPHRAVMARTPTEGWYAEELFARFAVDGVEGTHRGRTP